MAQEVRIENQNWVMIPMAGSALTEPDNAHRNWMMILSGIASITFDDDTGSWTCENFNIYPDWQTPVNYARDLSGLPAHFRLTFRVQQWAPFVSINSAYNMLGNAFSIDYWNVLVSPEGEKLPFNIFNGITFRAVRIAKADVYRVGYQITLYGSLGGFYDL